MLVSGSFLTIRRDIETSLRLIDRYSVPVGEVPDLAPRVGQHVFQLGDAYVADSFEMQEHVAYPSRTASDDQQVLVGDDPLVLFQLVLDDLVRLIRRVVLQKKLGIRDGKLRVRDQSVVLIGEELRLGQPTDPKILQNGVVPEQFPP